MNDTERLAWVATVKPEIRHFLYRGITPVCEIWVGGRRRQADDIYQAIDGAEADLKTQ